MFERWHWTLGDVEDLDWFEFCLLADAVKHLNERDELAVAEARARASKGR